MTHSYVCDMTCLYVWPASSICVTWLLQMCDMTCSDVWHDPVLRRGVTTFMHVTCLICMCDMSRSHGLHDSSICGTWLEHKRDMPQSYVCMTHAGRCGCRSVTWLIHVWHDAFMCVTWIICQPTRGRLVRVRDMWYSYVTWRIHMWKWLICVCDMKYDTCVCVRVGVRTCVCVLVACMLPDLQMYTCIQTCVCVYVYTYTQTHTHTHAHAHSPTRTHAQTRTQTQL